MRNDVIDLQHQLGSDFRVEVEGLTVTVKNQTDKNNSVLAVIGLNEVKLYPNRDPFNGFIFGILMDFAKNYEMDYLKAK